jgi:hypothetical protein
VKKGPDIPFFPGKQKRAEALDRMRRQGSNEPLKAPPAAERGVRQGYGHRRTSKGHRMRSTSEVVKSLLQRLFTCSATAREARIDHEDATFAEANSEVRQTLALLRERYKLDTSDFDESLLADIRACEISAGIITREDLDREAEERAYEAYAQDLDAKHRSYLASRGRQSTGMRVAMHRRRETHCYCHRAWLDSRIHMECNTCGGIVCYVCGGCFC